MPQVIGRRAPAPRSVRKTDDTDSRPRAGDPGGDGHSCDRVGQLAPLSMATKLPCQVCSQIAPVVVWIESIPVILPPCSVWKVK